MSNEQEQVEIVVQETLDATRRSMLVTKLEHEAGINSAWFEHGDTHHLLIQYDSDSFSHLTLLETLNEHGFHGTIAGN
jgi:hypothetical protein